MTDVWAHRGASAYAPENTIAAFSLAATMGAHGVELDVQLSADGEVVVIHDETLDRTTDGSGPVGERTLAELGRLNAGRGERIPTLSQVFDLLRPTGLEVNVELKNSEVPYPGLEERVLDVVAAHGMTDRVWYSSFQHYSIRRLLALEPTARTGLLYVEPLWEAWRYLADVGAAASHPAYPVAEIAGWVAGHHERGLRVHTWTVNAAADMQRQGAAGVDVIITNHPDVALSVLR